MTATTDSRTGSVFLSWTLPINSSQCVVGYIINSTLPNSTASISTTLNHTLFAVDGVLSSCTYSASVAANDTAGRIGKWSQVLFSFNGSSNFMTGVCFCFCLLQVSASKHLPPAVYYRNYSIKPCFRINASGGYKRFERGCSAVD